MSGYNDGIAIEDLEVASFPLYPFKDSLTPDRHSRQTRREYLVDAKSYTPKISVRNSWQNLATYSEQIDHANWTKTAASVTANAATAPDGSATADKLVEDGTNAAHRLSQQVTVGAGALTVGVAVAAAGRNRVRIALYNATDLRFAEASIDLSSRGYNAIAGSVVRVNALEDGWVFISISGTATVANSSLYIETEANSGANSYAGDSASGLLIWRPTVVTGTSAPPLIDTTSAARTILAPVVDREDPLAFLCIETDPNKESEEFARVIRVFSRVPRQQTVPSSLFAQRPEISGDFPQVAPARSSRVA